MMYPDKQINYKPLVIPLTKSFVNLSKQESQEYFDWFISHIDQRSDYLRLQISKDLDVSIETLNFSLDSLVPIWRWFLQIAEIAKTSPKDLKDLEESLARQPQSFIRQIVEQSKDKLSVFTEYVLRDIGMYLAKMFITNYPILQWTIKRTPKTYVHVNVPLIVGFVDNNPSYPKPFHPDLEPIDLARTPAMNLFSETQQDDDLYNVCNRWIQWIPKCDN